MFVVLFNIIVIFLFINNNFAVFTTYSPALLDFRVVQAVPGGLLDPENRKVNCFS